MTDRLKWEELEDTSSNTITDDEFDKALRETSNEFDDTLRRLSE